MGPDLVVPDVFGEVVGWRAWKIIKIPQAEAARGDGPALEGAVSALAALGYGPSASPLLVPRLQSVTHGKSIGLGYWPTNTWAVAQCDRGHVTGIPVESCSCGLYAARDRDHLIDLAYGAYGRNEITAIGEVAFAGKVITGSQGFRAEKGRIKSLIIPHEFWREAEALSDAYRIEVSTGFLFAPRERQRILERERKRSRMELERERLDRIANRKKEE